MPKVVVCCAFPCVRQLAARGGASPVALPPTLPPPRIHAAARETEPVVLLLVGGLRGEGHLVEELLLREPPEVHLLLGVGGERGVFVELLQHLLVQRLREQPLRRLLLPHLDLRVEGERLEGL